MNIVKHPSSRTLLRNKLDEIYNLSEVDFLILANHLVTSHQYTYAEIANLIGIQPLALQKRISRYKQEAE